ncbi:MAG: hypothetical protein RR998_07970 [Oscillospiraceae bacterium]
MDSLKEISKYFPTSLDDLLSSEEILTLAQADSKQEIRHFQDIVLGLPDCSVVMFLFLPFFGQRPGTRPYFIERLCKANAHFARSIEKT